MKATMIHLIRYKYGYIVAAIIFVAFILRLALFVLYPDGLSPDAQSYYTAALNIVNGNGYSDHTEAPYLPFYFREPVTSYSMSFFVWGWKWISGASAVPYPSSWLVRQMEPCHQVIIFFIRIGSSILQLFGLLLFSTIVKRHSSKKAALAFLSIGAVYSPLIFYSSLLLREVYLFFLLMLITWFWDKFLFSGKWLYLIATALTGGFICLCLHLYWILLLMYLPLLAIHLKRNNGNVIARCMVFAIAFFLPTLPWVIKVYNYYPDIRIVKTLGSGLTVDYTNGLNAYRAFGVDPYSAKQGDLPRDIPVRTDIFSITDVRKNFQYTFDGTYRKEATRINSENTTATLLRYYGKRLLLAFRNTVFIVGITYDYGIFHGQFSKKDILKFLFCLPWLLMGILAFMGLLSVIKRYWIIMPTFFYNTLFFFAYGDEERRQYVLIPWIIVLSMYSVWRFLKKKQRMASDHSFDIECI